MKLILLTILFLCTLTSQAWAWGVVGMGGGVTAATPAVDFCNGVSADPICEDVESTTACYTAGDEKCRHTWTRTVTGGTIVFSTASTKCSTTNNLAIQIDKTSQAAVVAYKTWTDAPLMYLIAYVKPSAVSATTTRDAVFTLYGDGAVVLQLSVIKPAAVNLFAALRYGGSVVNSVNTIDTSKWYKVVMKYQQSLSSCSSSTCTGTSGSADGFAYLSIQPDGGAEEVLINDTSLSICCDTDELDLGNPAAGQNITWTMLYDNIILDNDTEPAPTQTCW